MTSEERAKVLFWRTHYQGPSAMNLELSLDDTITEFAEEIDAAVAEALPQWVTVWERLPDAHDDVIVTALAPGGSTYRALGFYTLDHGWRVRGDAANVVAWQPLPAPWVAP